ncbi:MAG: diaminopimelate epimerase, partial [Candidatus Lokiarchaeota archaeon]|nr:diaminopimelate epimerase [Candidatus Lokiarchaeota archaeon]
VDDLNSYPVKELGPLIENHNLFPSKTNVNFVEFLNTGEVKMVTWERGAGLTLACGTGACAAATILWEKNKIQDQVLIHLPGGILNISKVGEEIFMTGPAQECFSGDIDIERLLI